MHTLRLNVNEKVYDKLLKLLGKFSEDEIEIISETFDLKINQKYLDHELKEILNGSARFIELDEVEQRLENVILKHENSIVKKHD